MAKRNRTSPKMDEIRWIARPEVLRIARRVPPSPGGQEQHVARLAAAQTSAGMPNTVIYAEGEVGAASGYSGLKVPGPLGWMPSDYGRGLGFAFGVAASRRYLENRKFTIVHSHGTSGELLAAARLNQTNIRAFHSFHALLNMSRHIRFTYARLLPRLDGIFVVSEAIRDQLQRSVPNLPRIHVLSSAADAAFFQVERIAKPTRALMIGSLTPMKGFDLGLRAAAILFRQGAISGVDIVGAGKEEMRLRQVAYENNLSAVFHGQLDKPELAKLMSLAAVLLCPSRTLARKAEGSPTVILESWAAGIPVVACASGGIETLVRHGIDGLLSPENDIAALVKHAQQAINKPEQLVLAGRRRVRGYTWEHLAGEIMAVYESERRHNESL